MKNLQHHLSTLLFLAAFACVSAQVSAATVSGRVWDDLNTNGIQDAGEPGVGGVWVLLNTPAGVQITGVQTNASGDYSLTNVAAGTYQLKFANPGGGYFFTKVNQGSDDSKDSDASVWGLVDFTTSANQTFDYDAGLTKTPNGCFTPITVVVSNVTRNLNGTPCNFNDDTFSFTVTATGGTGAWGWDIVSLNLLMQPYGTPKVLGPFPIAQSPMTLTLIDHDNKDCAETFTVTIPPPPMGNLTLTCLPNSQVWTDPGKETWKVVVPTPTAITTCTPNTVTITQTSGPAANANVGPGTYTFTFRAEDECCNTKTCSSTIVVKAPCDTYIQGPTIVDLLEVVAVAPGQPHNHKMYTHRVTNTGNNPMTYVAFSLPDGVTADSPANGSVYTAPSGRKYDVRNPNFSPFYSIRFKTAAGQAGLAGGQSDIFKYTLKPAPVNPWNIHAIVRLEPKIFHDWYLSTAKCMPTAMVGNTNNWESEQLEDAQNAIQRGNISSNGTFAAYPNPASNLVNIDLTKWEGQSVRLSMLNTQGQIVREFETVANGDVFQIQLETLPTGIYFLRGIGADSASETLRLVVRN